MNAAIEEPLYIKPSKVAQQIGVTKRTVLNMLYRHEIEGVLFGGQWLVSKSSLAAYIEQHKDNKRQHS